jgi:hypothetical protein
MSYEAEWQAIRDRWRTQWAVTTTQYGDAPFTAPADGSAYARLWVNTQPAVQPEIGASPSFRHPGTVTVQIFVPADTGDDTIASTYIDPACAVWRRYSASGIVFRTPYARRAGVTDRGYIEWLVIAPYYRDTTF